jgi:hypothetical protein
MLLSEANRRAAILRSVSGVMMEALEQRLLFTAATADLTNTPVPIQLPEAQLPLQGVVGTPLSLDPQMVNTAYEFNEIGLTDTNGNIYRGDGTGTTIAIVDPFSAPTLVNDVETFDSHWGISNNDGEGNFFLTIQPLGGSNNTPGPVDSNADWAEETSLDVEWAHAVAPGAHVLLVQAPSNGRLDLLDSVVYAAEQPGVVTVSMSWGEPDFAKSFLYDGFLATPDGHLDSNGIPGGVSFVVASGDDSTLQYPSAGINAISVGGMTTSFDINGNFQAEAPWELSGGGTPQYVQPWHVPYVALDADPASGVWIYDSTPNSSKQVGWQVVGGTSFGAPAFAAYMSIVDQGLQLQNAPSLTSPAAINAIEYLGERDENDFITYWGGTPPTYPLWGPQGPIPDRTKVPNNGNTGFGSPEGLNLAQDMVDLATGNDSAVFDSTTAAQLSFTQQPTDITAGNVISPSITVADPHSGSVTLSISSLSPGGVATLLGNTTVTVTNGVATFTGLTIHEAGTYELLATSSGALSALSTSFTVAPGVASGELVPSNQPTNTWQFTAQPDAVTFAVEDQYGNPVASSGTPVTLKVLTGPSGVFTGTSSTTMVNGVASFSGLTFATPGTYTLEANAGVLGVTDTTSFTVVAIPVMHHFLLNGASLGPVLVLLQQQRNAPSVAINGEPTEQDIESAISADIVAAEAAFNSISAPAASQSASPFVAGPSAAGPVVIPSSTVSFTPLNSVSANTFVSDTLTTASTAPESRKGLRALIDGF